jgi:hypothetical protein
MFHQNSKCDLWHNYVCCKKTVNLGTNYGRIGCQSLCLINILSFNLMNVELKMYLLELVSPEGLGTLPIKGVGLE